MKLYDLMRRRKQSKRDRRFYTLRDMAEVKHDEAKKNSRIKRGEEASRPNNIIVECGCGTEGCFLHIGFDNPIQYSGWKSGIQNSHNSGNEDLTIKTNKQ